MFESQGKVIRILKNTFSCHSAFSYAELNYEVPEVYECIQSLEGRLVGKRKTYIPLTTL